MQKESPRGSCPYRREEITHLLHNLNGEQGATIEFVHEEDNEYLPDELVTEDMTSRERHAATGIRRLRY